MCIFIYICIYVYIYVRELRYAIHVCLISCGTHIYVYSCMYAQKGDSDAMSACTYVRVTCNCHIHIHIKVYIYI